MKNSLSVFGWQSWKERRSSDGAHRPRWTPKQREQGGGRHYKRLMWFPLGVAVPWGGSDAEGARSEILFTTSLVSSASLVCPCVSALLFHPLSARLVSSFMDTRPLVHLFAKDAAPVLALSPARIDMPAPSKIVSVAPGVVIFARSSHISALVSSAYFDHFSFFRAPSQLFRSLLEKKKKEYSKR